MGLDRLIFIRSAIPSTLSAVLGSLLRTISSFVAGLVADVASHGLGACGLFRAEIAVASG
jgi:hypothetical protein